jgi:hypothetical protein
MVNSCAYGKVTRNMVENITNEVRTGFNSMEKRLIGIEKNQIDLFNHQSSRLPMWATILITLLSSAVVGFAVLILKGGI